MIVSAVSLLGRLLLVPVVLGLLCVQSLARGSETDALGSLFDKSNDWSVFKSSRKQSCTLVMGRQGEYIVYFGLSRHEDGMRFYFAFAKHGMNLSSDEKYNLEVKYDKGGLWREEVSGARVGDYGGFYINGLESKFVVDFAASQKMRVTIDGAKYGDFSIRGSREGMLRVFDCMD
ncbi:hypothetical protein SAMN05192571_109162 [Pleomorphomonas diazotrophica]|nr:hypothetical protein [Pleomorphomonas diazotrophica]SFM93769.1 hypothetical protein SAMN05192571_109162 [Pleomorphomonas diazotrophica]